MQSGGLHLSLRSEVSALSNDWSTGIPDGGLASSEMQHSGDSVARKGYFITFFMAFSTVFFIVFSIAVFMVFFIAVFMAFSMTFSMEFFMAFFTEVSIVFFMSFSMNSINRWKTG